MTDEQLILAPIKDLDDEQFIKAFSLRCEKARENNTPILIISTVLEICYKEGIMTLERVRELDKKYNNVFK